MTVERIDREHFAEGSLTALRRALERVGEMVLEVDRHGNVVDANETALSVLGYERDALRGVALASIDADMGAGGFETLYEQLRVRGSYRGRRTTGPALARPSRSKCGAAGRAERSRVHPAARARRDASARRAEEALTESAERFRALFDESPVATLLLDAGFRIIGANRAASDTLGYTIDEMTGKDPEELI